MNDDFEKDPLAEALRASLARHADDAPPADPLAERIVAAAARPPARPARNRTWRSWTLPVVAAAAVGAVVLAVVGIENYRPEPRKAPPAASPTAPTATPTPPAKPAVAALGRRLPAAAAPHVAADTGLKHFRIVDSTFVGRDDGWLLGTADCLDGSGGVCPAMLRTTDGGRTWHAAPQPPGNPQVLTCADPCIVGLRFASATVGYAFSPTALEMTTDGGAHWTMQAGGAEALETLDGNVIRLVSDPPGCTEACAMTIQTAPVGSSSWRTVRRLDVPVATLSARLVRVGSQAAVLVSTGRESGLGLGAPGTSSVLYTSGDAGATWQRRGDPCRSAVGPAFTAQAVGGAGDGTLGLLCTDGAGSDTEVHPVLASSFSGEFRARPALPFDAVIVTGLAVASSDVLLVATGTGLYRSADAGGSWQAVGIPDGMMMNSAGAPGFSDDRTAHWSTGGSQLWTTHDQGRHWNGMEFG